jgi:hypothetical protein
VYTDKTHKDVACGFDDGDLIKYSPPRSDSAPPTNKPPIVPPLVDAEQGPGSPVSPMPVGPNTGRG